MSWRHPTERDWDHKRDLRKHDTPPLPDRMDKPLTTAMDIVVLVKKLDNYEAAAKWVEWYADHKLQEHRLDAAVTAGARA
jgi:hypothetical protein